MSDRILESIEAIIENGRRLLEDADMIEFGEPPATAFFIIRIAQEEFAKAFLLFIVHSGAIPWNKHILRATRDHRCKQLLCAVMDWINPSTDWFLTRCNDDKLRHELFEFTTTVADAINILRYEKNWAMGCK